MPPQTAGDYWSAFSGVVRRLNAGSCLTELSDSEWKRRALRSLLHEGPLTFVNPLAERSAPPDVWSLHIGRKIRWVEAGQSDGGGRWPHRRWARSLIAKRCDPSRGHRSAMWTPSSPRTALADPLYATNSADPLPRPSRCLRRSHRNHRDDEIPRAPASAPTRQSALLPPRQSATSTVLSTHSFFEPWRDRSSTRNRALAIYGSLGQPVGRGRTRHGVISPTIFFRLTVSETECSRVILDHRGYGGRRGRAAGITQLVRSRSRSRSVRGFMAVGAVRLPVTAAAEGKAFFDRFPRLLNLLYEVGSNRADTALPVAALIRGWLGYDWLLTWHEGIAKLEFCPHERRGVLLVLPVSYGRVRIQVASGARSPSKGIR